MNTTEELALDANGIRCHALAAGPSDGRLVLLLHGFPELSRSWRHQLPVLAAAGYRAVAPDLRGYGKTERRGPYGLRTLAGDVAGLVHALGSERAVVVGHDWGGGAAWASAHLRPEVVERLVVLNCPPLATFGREVQRNPRQLRRSAYIALFQLPVIAEHYLSRDRAAAIARALRRGVHVRGAFPDDEVELYRQAFSTRAALRGPLGWYRAAFRHPRRDARSLLRSPITAPTLILWGLEDRFLGRETIRPELLGPAFAPGNEPEVVWIDGAGHFLQNEAPERVSAELLRWLAATGGRSG